MAENPGFIFDMDGVIVDSNPAHKETIQKFCKKYNHDVSESFFKNHLFGRTNEEWIPQVFGEIGSEKIKELADEKEQLFRDNFNPEDHIVSGILEFIDVLHQQNIPMAVATSAPVENADFILSHLSIADYFAAILNSSHVTKGKPDPEIYLKASAALGRSPENCFVFEDSVAGVKAGLAAGATVIGVATTHSKEELSTCHLAIDDFKKIELERLLELVPN